MDIETRQIIEKRKQRKHKYTFHRKNKFCMNVKAILWIQTDFNLKNRKRRFKVKSKTDHKSSPEFVRLPDFCDDQRVENDDQKIGNHFDQKKF